MQHTTGLHFQKAYKDPKRVKKDTQWLQVLQIHVSCNVNGSAWRRKILTWLDHTLEWTRWSKESNCRCFVSQVDKSSYPSSSVTSLFKEGYAPTSDTVSILSHCAHSPYISLKELCLQTVSGQTWTLFSSLFDMVIVWNLEISIFQAKM